MALNLISTHTISSAVSSLSITSGISSAYTEYEFHFVGLSTSSSSGTTSFQFQVNSITAGGTQQTGFNEQITSISLSSYHSESDGGPSWGTSYYGSLFGTGYQKILAEYIQGGTGDEGAVGTLAIYNPSGTVHQKKFYAEGTAMGNTSSYSLTTKGYIDTTNAINQINFKFASGNINNGTIRMYGVG